MTELKRLINRAISLILQGQSQGAETVLERAIEEIDRVSATVKAMENKVIYLPDFQKDYSMDGYWPGYNDGLRTAGNAIESQGYRVEVKGEKN